VGLHEGGFGGEGLKGEDRLVGGEADEVRGAWQSGCNNRLNPVYFPDVKTQYHPPRKSFMKSIPVVFAVILFTLAACTSNGPQGDACPSRNEVLRKLEEVVPYEEYSLSFNTSKEGSLLTLWVVNPQVDSHTEEGLRDGIALALLEATAVVHQMYKADECTGELFDRANVIIVDPDYVGVFSGVLSLENMPDSASLSEDELVTLATSFEVDYRLRDPMEAFTPPPSDACTWKETREKIADNFALSNPNVDFFYMFDALGSTVWAQFLGPIEGGTTGYAVLKVGDIIDDLDCLYPPANKINTIIVDGEGEVLVVGTIAEVEEGSANAVNGFDINDYTFSMMLESEEE
jgi:hypothetical protein